MEAGDARRIFFRPSCAPLRHRSVLSIGPRRSDRSRPHARAHRQGWSGVLYRGEIAEAIVADVKANGGVLGAEDLAKYEARVGKRARDDVSRPRVDHARWSSGADRRARLNRARRVSLRQTESVGIDPFISSPKPCARRSCTASRSSRPHHAPHATTKIDDGVAHADARQGLRLGFVPKGRASCWSTG